MINRGLHQYRFDQNPLEKRYAEAWEDTNLNIHKEEDGRGTLDYLMSLDNNPKGEVTDRDRVVAATVIQWLGSPVGQFFVERVLKGGGKEDVTHG